MGQTDTPNPSAPSDDNRLWESSFLRDMRRRINELDDIASALDLAVDAAGPILDEDNANVSGALRATSRCVMWWVTNALLEITDARKRMSSQMPLPVTVEQDEARLAGRS